MDDLLPNDGEMFNAFQEPEEQVKERQKSVSQAQAAKPMLEQLIALFAADIDSLDRISSIPVDVDTQTDEFLAAWRQAQGIRQYAEQKKSYLESLLSTTKR